MAPVGCSHVPMQSLCGLYPLRLCYTFGSRTRPVLSRICFHDLAQQQIHTETTIVVRANTHWWNRLGSWLSNGFASLSAVFSRSFGSFGGARAGKPFTPAGKRTVLERNAAENGGTNVCENCGQPTVPAQQSQGGVPRPGNESNVDHIYPRSQGGDGDPGSKELKEWTESEAVVPRSSRLYRDEREVCRDSAESFFGGAGAVFSAGNLVQLTPPATPPRQPSLRSTGSCGR